MTTIPKVPKMTLDPCPKEKCVEVDRKRFARRKALRHPPSSSMRSSRRLNIWNNSDKILKGTNRGMTLSCTRWNSTLQRLSE